LEHIENVGSFGFVKAREELTKHCKRQEAQDTLTVSHVRLIYDGMRKPSCEEDSHIKVRVNTVGSLRFLFLWGEELGKHPVSIFSVFTSFDEAD
jgi:hypothetical protein